MILSLVQSNIVDDSRVIRACEIAKKIDENSLCIGLFEESKKEKYLNLDDFNIRFSGRLQRDKKRNKLLKIFDKISIMGKMILIGASYKPVIIHANDLDTMLPGILLSKVFKSKLIFDAHEIYSENTTFSKNPFLKFIIDLVERFAVKQADEIITVSYAAKDFYQRKYKINNIEVITNTPNSLKNNFSEKDNQFTVSTHGYFLPNRGLEEISSIAKILEGENINLIIRGEGKLEKKLNEILLDQNLKQNVLKPMVNNKKLISLISQYHIGLILTKPVNSNYKYSVSNKLFEYINAGVPVIMSNIPEHIMINKKYNVGIIIEEVTSQSIFNAIMSLRKDKSLYEELSLNCLEAAKILNWDTESRKLIKMYKTI